MKHYSENIDSMTTRGASARVDYDELFNDYRVSASIKAGPFDAAYGYADPEDFYTDNLEDARNAARMMLDTASGCSAHYID